MEWTSGYTPEMPRLTTLFAVAVLAFAQHPYSTLPRNYRLEFENQWVRISRVKYIPGDRLPVHSHPSIPTVYVYLTDGGPIRFIHISPKFTLERPAVKAGGVRFNRNAKVETHETEYLGDSPSEYLRVELKTIPGPPHRDARLRTDSDFPWEDPQLRISTSRGRVPALVRPAVLVNIPLHSFAWLDPADPQSSSITSEPGWFVVLKLKSDRLDEK
jgi:hypothetical protein